MKQPKIFIKICQIVLQIKCLRARTTENVQILLSGAKGFLKLRKCRRSKQREFQNSGNAVVRNNGNSKTAEMLSFETTGISKQRKCCRSRRREFHNCRNADVRSDRNSVIAEMPSCDAQRCFRKKSRARCCARCGQLWGMSHNSVSSLSSAF